MRAIASSIRTGLLVALAACGSSPPQVARAHAYEACTAIASAQVAAGLAAGKSDLDASLSALPGFVACIIAARATTPEGSGAGSGS